MALNLTMFNLSPTLKGFDKCRKDDLLLIADFSDIAVPRLAAKKVVMAALYEALVALQVLPEQEAHPGVST